MSKLRICEIKQIYIGDKGQYFLESYDVLIFAPNIEHRSRHFYREVYRGIDKSRLIAFDFYNFHEEIDDESQEAFYDEFSDSNIEFINVNSRDFGKAFLNLFSAHKYLSIALDITGFSIPNIYQMLYILNNNNLLNRVDLFYTEPKFYVYDKGYFDQYHKTPRVERNCAPVAGFMNSGKTQEEILVLFLGFDGGLSSYVYSKIGEESQDVLETFAVNGLPSYTVKLKDISLLNNRDLITKIGSERLFYSAANNPFSVYNTLVDLYEKNKGTLLNLCTIGSKPMAVGGCLFALDYKKSVKVIYPFYEKIRFDKQEKPGTIWKYSIRNE